MGSIAGGEAQNLSQAMVPVLQAVGDKNAAPLSWNGHPMFDTKAADALNSQFGNHYGSWNDFLHYAKTDPVGPLADASILLSGGETAAARGAAALGEASDVGNILGKTAKVLGKGSEYTAPITGQLKLAGDASKAVIPNMGIGAKVGDTVSQIISHATDVPTDYIKEAYSAGREGGLKQSIFQDAQNGKLDANKVADTVENEVASNHPAIDAQPIVDATKDYLTNNFHSNPSEMEGIVQDFMDNGDFSPKGIEGFRNRVGEVRDALDTNAPELENSADKFKRMQDGNFLSHLYDNLGTQLETQAPDYLKVREAADNVRNGTKGAIDDLSEAYQKFKPNSDIAATKAAGEETSSLFPTKNTLGHQIVSSALGLGGSVLGIGHGLPEGGSLFGGGFGLGTALQSPRIAGSAANLTGRLARGYSALEEFGGKYVAPNTLPTVRAADVLSTNQQQTAPNQGVLQTYMPYLKPYGYEK